MRIGSLWPSLSNHKSEPRSKAMSPVFAATLGQRTEPPTNVVNCFPLPVKSKTHKFGVRLGVSVILGMFSSSLLPEGVGSPIVTVSKLKSICTVLDVTNRNSQPANATNAGNGYNHILKGRAISGRVRRSMVTATTSASDWIMV